MLASRKIAQTTVDADIATFVLIEDKAGPALAVGSAVLTQAVTVGPSTLTLSAFDLAMRTLRANEQAAFRFLLEVSVSARIRREQLEIEECAAFALYEANLQQLVVNAQLEMLVDQQRVMTTFVQNQKETPKILKKLTQELDACVEAKKLLLLRNVLAYLEEHNGEYWQGNARKAFEKSDYEPLSATVKQMADGGKRRQVKADSFIAELSNLDVKQYFQRVLMLFGEAVTFSQIEDVDSKLQQVQEKVKYLPAVVGAYQKRRDVWETQKSEAKETTQELLSINQQSISNLTDIFEQLMQQENPPPPDWSKGSFQEVMTQLGDFEFDVNQEDATKNTFISYTISSEYWDMQTINKLLACKAELSFVTLLLRLKTLAETQREDILIELDKNYLCAQILNKHCLFAVLKLIPEASRPPLLKRLGSECMRAEIVNRQDFLKIYNFSGGKGLISRFFTKQKLMEWFPLGSQGTPEISARLLSAINKQLVFHQLFAYLIKKSNEENATERYQWRIRDFAKLFNFIEELLKSQSKDMAALAKYIDEELGHPTVNTSIGTFFGLASKNEYFQLREQFKRVGFETLELRFKEFDAELNLAESACLAWRRQPAMAAKITGYNRVVTDIVAARTAYRVTASPSAVSTPMASPAPQHVELPIERFQVLQSTNQRVSDTAVAHNAPRRALARARWVATTTSSPTPLPCLSTLLSEDAAEIRALSKLSSQLSGKTKGTYDELVSSLAGFFFTEVNQANPNLRLARKPKDNRLKRPTSLAYQKCKEMVAELKTVPLAATEQDQTMILLSARAKSMYVLAQMMFYDSDFQTEEPGASKPNNEGQGCVPS